MMTLSIAGIVEAWKLKAWGKFKQGDEVSEPNLALQVKWAEEEIKFSQTVEMSMKITTHSEAM